MAGGVGPRDKQTVDAAAADRGKGVYAAECINCHGSRARGVEGLGSDLVRSQLLLHDRYGNELVPFLQRNHPLQSGRPGTALSKEQILDITHFLKLMINNTLKTGPFNRPINVLTGDAEAGREYFNGRGKCNTCHSTTGDLAGVGTRLDPVALQQRFLFPASGVDPRVAKPIMVTVNDGKQSTTGTLEKIDDFFVSLRDASGDYKSFARGPEVRVELDDPRAAHIALLDEITDQEIHNVVAFLERLK